VKDTQIDGVDFPSEDRIDGIYEGANAVDIRAIASYDGTRQVYPQRKDPEKGREAAAPSNIKEIQEIQGGKKHHTMVTQSTPKMPKWHHSGLINPSLNTRVPGGPKGINGHSNLNGSNR
jgi:hypothetical protein